MRTESYRNYLIRCYCQVDTTRAATYLCSYEVYMIDKYQYSFNFNGTMQWAIKFVNQNLWYEFIRDEGFSLSYGLIDTGKEIKEKEGRRPEEFNAEDYELPEKSKITYWEIRNDILNALNRIKKENPDTYKSGEFNKGDGFCKVLKISRDDFLYNIGYLEENGLIKKDKVYKYIYITTKGIDWLEKERYKYRIIDPITSEIQKFVHDRLNEIKPDIFNSLQGIKRQLVEGGKDFKWQQVAFGCRDIIQDFTHSLYKPEYLPKGEKAPKKPETKRKLKFILEDKLNKYEDTERELLEGLIEYLYKYFDCINSLIQKGVHKDIEKADAERCLIYTYLFIGDVLRLTKL